MSGSYRQCSICGKRALSIATRCPGCGRELPSPQSPEGSRPVRLPSVQSLLGLLALGAALVAGWEARRRGAAENAESSYATTAERAEPGDGSAPLASAPLAATPRLDSAAPPPHPSHPGGPAASGPSSPAVADTGRLLVARTWTNVRNRRSVKGGLEAVLTPGDTVLADSLSHGWYRVALEGEVMGYASASTLTSVGSGSAQPQ
ncbi:MAG TPA: hypothetical protein VHR43_01795 [Gemmatimonadales bacterium]|nr:hypothetical protein [Gemmatimonadales bacterium]